MFFYVAFVPAIFLILAIHTARQSVFAAFGYALVVMITLVVARYYLPQILALAESQVPDYIGIDRYEHSFYRWLFYFSPYTRVLEFFMGCLAAHAYILHLDRAVTPKDRQFANVALVATLAMLGLFGALYVGAINIGALNTYIMHLSLNFLCAPAIGFILFYVARYDTGFTRFMSSPMLVTLGDTSYSIYLIHSWTLRIFTRAPAPDVSGLWVSEAMFRVAAVACGIVLTVLVSYAAYHLIEVPSRAWVRRKLGRLIAVGFGDAPGPRQPPEFVNRHKPVSPLWARVSLSGGMMAVLVSIVVVGQAGRSERIAAVVHRLWFGERSEVAVGTATYGLNCRNFSVPANLSNSAAPGNASAPVKRACNGLTRCEYTVDVLIIGDPANSCGKEFLVEYRCTGSRELKSAFLPAEANGKTVTLMCESELPN